MFVSSRKWLGLVVATLVSIHCAQGQVVPGVNSEGMWIMADDPASDGWNTEAFSELASDYLKKLGTGLVEGDSRSSEQDLMSGVDAILMPGGIEVRRWQAVEEAWVQGELAVIEALRPFFPGEAEGSTRFKFKVTSVGELEGGVTPTVALLETFSRTSDGWVEYHCDLEMGWEGSAKGSGELTQMRIKAVEEIRRPNGEGLMFSDCTRSALEHNDSYEEQILRGLPHWLKRQVRRRATDVYGFPGIGVGDVNGDGLEDLFVCESEGVPHSLYLQNPDGTLTNRAEEWGVDWLDDARSVLILDLDNDGDQDLALGMIGILLVASNEGDHFEVKAALSCSEDVTHLSSADFDLDGKLDLYVSAYLPSGPEEESTSRTNPGYYLNSERGAPNSLFRNLITSDGWGFAEVTESAGLNVGNAGQTLSSSWEDFDQDGDVDLYVANDFGSNRLYRNDLADDGSRVFEDIANAVGTEDTAFGMSAAWGDYNRDGWMDLYVANMWSSAGKRITTHQNFRPGSSPEALNGFQHLARGNTLLMNNGEGGFEDVSEEAGVTMGRWAWSSPFVDFNNDGWEDLVVANGFITGTGPGDL